jgi:hypothetical protein
MGTRATIQHFDGCPGWTVARDNLAAAARELGVTLDLSEERVETVEDAERLGFVGSPTILLDGVDPFRPPDGTGRPALACRLYPTPEGPSPSPSVAQLVAAIEGAGPAPGESPH